MATAIDAIPQEVRESFLNIARMLKRSGHARYSADAIVHRIRWHFQVEKGRREFKCNNNWTATLARWAIDRSPDLASFFETRRSAARAET